jgi:hypothetical protein
MPIPDYFALNLDIGEIENHRVVLRIIVFDLDLTRLRAFVAMRQMAMTQKEILKRVDALERVAVSHDGKIKAVFDTIRAMVSAPEQKQRRIGFRPLEQTGKPGARGKR